MFVSMEAQVWAVRSVVDRVYVITLAIGHFRFVFKFLNLFL